MVAAVASGDTRHVRIVSYEKGGSDLHHGSAVVLQMRKLSGVCGRRPKRTVRKTGDDPNTETESDTMAKRKPTTTTPTDTTIATKRAPRAPRANKSGIAVLNTVPAVHVPTTPALALSDVSTVPAGYIVPAALMAWRDAFRATANMPSKTRDERAIIVGAMVAALDAAMPGTPTPLGRNTGRFFGAPVFESQNTLYVAAALANCTVTAGAIMAAWRVEMPNAKCDYIGRDYAWTTLSEFVNGRHNGSIVPDGVAIVVAWNTRNRQPIGASA